MITDHRNRDGTDAHATQGACRVAGRGATRRYASLCSGLLMLLLTLFCPEVKAQSEGSTATQESYDTLLDEAVSAFDASDFARARTLFERAYELRPNARVLRGMGIAALRLERFSEAYRTLTTSLKHPVQPLTASQRDEVTGLLSWMETSLGCIKLRWSPAEPAEYEVLVDGKVHKEVPIWLSAGTHRVAVHAPGFGAIDRTITLAPEQHEVIELTLKKRASPEVAKPKPAPAVMPSDAAHSLPAPETATAANAKARHTSGEQRDRAGDDGGSVFTRWWFWTAVAAVAAGGVATAVLLSQPAPTNPVDTSEGSQLVMLPSRGLP